MKYKKFQYQTSRKIQPKKMNSDNLQASNTKAIAYAMGIDYTMVKVKVAWYYLFSFAIKLQ